MNEYIIISNKFLLFIIFINIFIFLYLLSHIIIKVIKKITSLEIIVKYQFASYKINFKDGIRVYKLQLYLLYKRFGRLIKRILIANKQLILFSVLVLFFISIFIIYGIFANKYNSYLNGLWDFKDTIITSIIVVFFMNSISSEKNRHDNLVSQYYIYSSLCWDFENYLSTLLKLLNINSYSDHILLTDMHHDKFINYLNSFSDIKITPNDYNCSTIECVSFINNNLLSFLTNIKNQTNSNNIEGFTDISNDTFDRCINNITNYTFKLKNTNENNLKIELINYINSISYQLFCIVASYRRPWRWDFDINQKIRFLLLEKGHLYKGIDYYLHAFTGK